MRFELPGVQALAVEGTRPPVGPVLDGQRELTSVSATLAPAAVAATTLPGVVVAMTALAGLPEAEAARLRPALDSLAAALSAAGASEPLEIAGELREGDLRLRIGPLPSDAVGALYDPLQAEAAEQGTWALLRLQRD
jgi:hypothetical protein